MISSRSFPPSQEFRNKLDGVRRVNPDNPTAATLGLTRRASVSQALRLLAGKDDPSNYQSPMCVRKRGCIPLFKPATSTFHPMEGSAQFKLEVSIRP